MKKNWKKELAGTEFDKTNDLDIYCDCLIKEYRKFPLNKIIEPGFWESEEAVRMNEKCEEESRK